MKQTELSVERPADFLPALWRALHPRLMEVLTRHYGIDPHDDECCNWLFDEFLDERQLRDVAVLVFGSDMPYAVNTVRNFRLVGDGDCPNCGSNTRSEITGGIRHEETYGTAFEVLGYHCLRCNYDDYR